MELENYTLINLENFLSSKVDSVKDKILSGYDTSLTSVAGNSVSNSTSYRDLFKKRLDEFNYLTKEDGNLIFNVPDISSFDFTDMNLIRQILEGTVGRYVEVPIDDVIKINRNIALNKEPVDGNFGTKFYLIKYTEVIKRAERGVLGRTLTVFPFSNTPPLYNNVFGPAIKHVNKNMKKWIDEGLEEIL